jgi:hypothetical protein
LFGRVEDGGVPGGSWGALSGALRQSLGLGAWQHDGSFLECSVHS